MMLSTLVLAVVLGWLLGGSLRRLMELPLRRMEVIFVAFALQAVLLWGPDHPLLHRWGFCLHMLSYALLLWVLWENRRIPGVLLLAFGILLNLVVIVTNGGMPVSEEALLATGQEDALRYLTSGGGVIHTLMEEDTILAVLGDHLITPEGFFRPTVLSPGDAVMMVGIVWLVPAAMRRKTAS